MNNWRKKIPQEQFEKVLKVGGGDIDGEFLGFTDVYEHLAAIIPTHWIIVDLGCAYAPQAWIFGQHKAYIGVNLGEVPTFVAPNSKFYFMSIEKFLSKHLKDFDQETTFAICSYVPPWGGDNMKMTRDAFKNCFVYYPAGMESPIINPN